MKKILKSIFRAKRIPVLIALVLLSVLFVMLCIMLFPGKKRGGNPRIDSATDNTPLSAPVQDTAEKAEEGDGSKKNDDTEKAEDTEPKKQGPSPEELYVPYNEEYAAKRMSEQNALCLLDGDIATGLQSYKGDSICVDKYVHGFPVTFISSSFRLPKKIKSLELPSSVIGILSREDDKLSDKGAFLGNKTLETFLPSDGLRYIGDKAFYECISLSDVFFPITLGHIGDRAFYGCTSLSDIKIYGNTSVGEGAFAGCASLENVYLSENVRRIGLGAFDDTPFYNAMTDEFCIVGDVLVKYNGKSADIVIPDGVRIIADGVFAGRISVKSVTVPKSVEYIGNSAFRSCARLDEIILHGNPVIGINAFDGCTDNIRYAVSGLSVDARDEFYSEVNREELTAAE